MIESTYYQILEYIAAPIGLMIFTFYVKGVDKDKFLGREFKQNAIESLFIASYSHLLYFFSLNAHENEIKNLECGHNQFANLLCSIGGLLTIFIYKYLYNVLRDELKERLIKRINTSTIVLMLLLSIIIIDTNSQIHHLVFEPNFDTVKSNFISLFCFFKRVDNLITLFLFLYLLYIISFNRPNISNSSLVKISDANKELNSSNRLQKYFSIANDSSENFNIRISSFIKLAENDYANLNFQSSLEYIQSAKQIAILNSIPESEIYGIRMLKCKILCELGLINSIESEIEELIKGMNLDSIENKSFYELWIAKLQDILKNCKNKAT